MKQAPTEPTPESQQGPDTLESPPPGRQRTHDVSCQCSRLDGIGLVDDVNRGAVLKYPEGPSTQYEGPTVMAFRTVWV